MYCLELSVLREQSFATLLLAFAFGRAFAHTTTSRILFVIYARTLRKQVLYLSLRSKTSRSQIVGNESRTCEIGDTFHAAIFGRVR